MVNYFKNCKNPEEAQKLFKELAKKYHPDTGNEKDSEKFAQISKDYTEFRTFYKIQSERSSEKPKLKIKINPKEVNSLIDSLSQSGGQILKVGLQVLAEKFIK